MYGVAESRGARRRPSRSGLCRRRRAELPPSPSAPLPARPAATISGSRHARGPASPGGHGSTVVRLPSGTPDRRRWSPPAGAAIGRCWLESAAVGPAARRRAAVGPCCPEAGRRQLLLAGGGRRQLLLAGGGRPSATAARMRAAHGHRRPKTDRPRPPLAVDRPLSAHCRPQTGRRRSPGRVARTVRPDARVVRLGPVAGRVPASAGRGRAAIGRYHAGGAPPAVTDSGRPP